MPRPDTLSIATLNLRHDADEWDRRAPLVVDELVRLHPHAVALQEVWRPIQQGQWLADQLNRKLEARGLGHYSFVERPKWGFQEDRESVGILTRLPILDTHGVDLPGGRVAIATLSRWGEAMIEVISVHLHYGPPDTADGIRRSQIRGMEAWLDERRAHEVKGGLPRPVTLLAGDFNATPDSEACALMRARFVSAYAQAHGCEPDWTYGTPLADRNNRKRGVGLFRGTLDYVFVPPEVKVTGAMLFCDKPRPDDPETYASDHIGVLAELQLG